MDIKKTKEKISNLSDKDLDMLDIMVFREKADRRKLENKTNNKNAFDFQNQQYNKIIKAKSFHHFADKSIIKIASGYNFYIALERNIHDVSKWTT